MTEQELRAVRAYLTAFAPYGGYLPNHPDSDIEKYASEWLEIYERPIEVVRVILEAVA